MIRLKKYLKSVVPAVCVDSDMDSKMCVQAGYVQDNDTVETGEYSGLQGVVGLVTSKRI